MGGVLMDAETARWMGAWMHEWMGSFPQVAEPSFLAIPVVLADYPFSTHSCVSEVLSGFEHPLLGAEVRRKLLGSQSSEEGWHSPLASASLPSLPRAAQLCLDSRMRDVVRWWPLLPDEDAQCGVLAVIPNPKSTDCCFLPDKPLGAVVGRPASLPRGLPEDEEVIPPREALWDVPRVKGFHLPELRLLPCDSTGLSPWSPCGYEVVVGAAELNLPGSVAAPLSSCFHSDLWLPGLPVSIPEKQGPSIATWTQLGLELG